MGCRKDGRLSYYYYERCWQHPHQCHQHIVSISIVLVVIRNGSRTCHAAVVVCGYNTNTRRRVEQNTNTIDSTIVVVTNASLLVPFVEVGVYPI